MIIKADMFLKLFGDGDPVVAIATKSKPTSLIVFGDGPVDELMSGVETLKSCVVAEQGANLMPADVIFIDGDRPWDIVMEDSDLASGLVNEGGVIIWDSYLHEPDNGASRAIDRINATSGNRIVHVAESTVCFLQRKKGETE